MVTLMVGKETKSVNNPKNPNGMYLTWVVTVKLNSHNELGYILANLNKYIRIWELERGTYRLLLNYGKRIGFGKTIKRFRVS